jgi:hypothetical protein
MAAKPDERVASEWRRASRGLARESENEVEAPTNGTSQH